MIDDLRAIAIFAEVIRQGSFRAAAKKLGLSASTVSYNISKLEQRVGTSLLYRSTRKLALTFEGECLYRNANDMLTSAAQGLKEITAEGGELRGTLNISATSALIRSRLNNQIAAFHMQNPGIELNISYSDIQHDIIGDGIDIAFRAGEMEDSSLKTKRVGQIERKLVCSKEYFESRKNPTHPSDLEAWDWVRLEMMPNRRTLHHIDKASVSVSIIGKVCVNSVEAMSQLCIQGLGICTPPEYLVEKELSEGDLVEVLPEWTVAPIPISAVWPGNSVINSNTRRLVEFIVNEGILRP